MYVSFHRGASISRPTDNIQTDTRKLISKSCATMYSIPSYALNETWNSIFELLHVRLVLRDLSVPLVISHAWAERNNYKGRRLCSHCTIYIVFFD